MSDLWTSRDLPVVQAVVFMDKRDRRAVKNLDELAALTTMDRDELVASMRALESAGYVEATPAHGGGSYEWLEIYPLPAAYEATKEWPRSDDLVRELLAAVEAVAGETEDDAESNRLREIGSTLRSLSEQTLANVVGVYLARVSGAS